MVAETEMEVMTVEHEWTDLIFTCTSLSSAGMSDRQIREQRLQVQNMKYVKRKTKKTNMSINKCDLEEGRK